MRELCSEPETLLKSEALLCQRYHFHAPRFIAFGRIIREPRHRTFSDVATTSFVPRPPCHLRPRIALAVFIGDGDGRGLVWSVTFGGCWWVAIEKRRGNA